MKTNVKPNEQVRNLKPYQVDQTEYPIRLDANETSNLLFEHGINIENFSFHRYPDHEARVLRSKLSSWLHVEMKHIVVGNGSSELIELIFKTFLSKGDRVISFEPTFSMYEVYAQLYGIRYEKIPWEKTSEASIDQMIEQIKREKPKAIFLCTPNNPTGFQLKKQDVKRLLNATDAFVIIDEAYIEFAVQEESLTQEVIAYPNACVLRTFSKAFGLASIRLGYMIAHENITSWINRVRSPYHVNQLSQWIGSVALDQRESVMNHIRLVIIERERLYREFIKLGLPVETSQGNFLYIQPSTYHLNDELKRRGIIIREWPNGSSRITVGQPHENDQLINALKEIIQ